MQEVYTIKLALRFKTDAFNGEIQDNILIALDDLARVGVFRAMIEKDNFLSCKDGNDMDSLIYKACELYCKWHFNFLGKGEQFRHNYENLRDALSLYSEYRCGR